MNTLLERIENGVVMLDPFRDGDDAVGVSPRSDHDLMDPGIDDLPFAHGTGHGVGKQFVGPCVTPDKIECGADHVAPGSGNDRGGLRMDASAQLVPLAGGNVQRLPGTDPYIGTVFSAPRGTVVTGGDDFVIPDDQCAVLSPQAGRTLQNGVCNTQIIIMFAGSVIQDLHTLSLMDRIISPLPEIVKDEWKLFEGCAESNSFLRVSVVK